MLLARGTVQDRPFGKTVGTIAYRGVTGQLTAESAGGTYAIAFDRGYVIAAASPVLADSTLAIAMSLDVIAPSQVPVVERWLESVPDADEFEVLATVAHLTAEEVHRLRRRVIAQRAARMLALERGDFVLTSTIALPMVRDCEMHVGGIIYSAARTFLTEAKLRQHVQAFGGRFELRTDAYNDLPYYGFGENEKAFLRELAAGVEIDTIYGDRHMALAALYALASCGAVYCEISASASGSLRFARGTNNPVRPSGSKLTPAVEMVTEPLEKGNAEEAFVRAQSALRGERLDDAVFDLELATQLAPNEPRYFAALAWARFCRAPDKARVANETRSMLGRAIAKSDSPILPHFYLGMVERMMNRTEQAIEHFREVLELQPNHREAAQEIRFLTRKPTTR
jgi:tetratricopeptide (TPR) repeat protein